MRVNKHCNRSVKGIVFPVNHPTLVIVQLLIYMIDYVVGDKVSIHLQSMFSHLLNKRKCEM
jgi:hypothetical protein